MNNYALININENGENREHENGADLYNESLDASSAFPRRPIMPYTAVYN